MAGKRAGEARARAERILEILEIEYPDAGLSLDFGTPFELLVATVLAAQCTDERVNLVTRDLFLKYTSPRDYLDVPVEELERDIHSTGFFRNKAKSIRNLSGDLIEKFDGKVPDDIDSLVSLYGVGRKTANIILGNAFGRDTIAVDTHVKRVSTRLGLASSEDPDRIEAELREVVPGGKWTLFTHLVVFHGRRCCKAKKPTCGECRLFDLCRFGEKDKFAA